ncbi:MAG TPA: cupin domain-containing protein, partial [Kiritimatiellia bacterium]|nr:cupin domain-containing protein [Kiritimatiellia bacterium]
MNSAENWIKGLELAPHPEGGWFRETYRSGESIRQDALPDRFGGDRAFSTAIYYLLRRGEFSALHRIASDEVWHVYAGGGLEVVCLHPEGEVERLRLGSDVAGGERPQAVVKAGGWFGAGGVGGGCCLAGCTVGPGFDFADFVMGDR